MKRITVILMALMCLTVANAKVLDSDTLKFMNAYREFAEFVVAQPSFTKPWPTL